MAGAHWKHHNHFVHYRRAGFDMLSTGYAARTDGDTKPQAPCEFDDIASTASQNEMLVQIPQALAQHRAGIPFKQFFVEV